MKVTLIQGGGLGLDQAPAVKTILQAAGAEIEWDEHLAGWASIERGGSALPEAMLESVRGNGFALKTKLLPSPSNTGHASGKFERNFNVQFRQELELFASVRPLRNMPGLKARFQNVDMVVIRELTEDLYTAIEHEIVPGVVQSIKVVTHDASQRFFRFALGWAKKANRKSVACVHKANILKLADGLLLEAFRETAKEFPELETREIIVDNCCMQMVSRPTQFDVLVMGNLYGDLISDLAAGIVGGISATSGFNYSEKIHVYETFHGGPRESIGVNRANPLPLLVPAMDLLHDIGQHEPAAKIKNAIASVLTEGSSLTSDLKGSATTSEMTTALVAALSA